MWRKIRKVVLWSSFVTSLWAIAAIAENGLYDSPTGLFLMWTTIIYLFWFTAVNIKRRDA